MPELPWPATLTWPDVDPCEHPFDPRAAVDVVRGLVPGAASAPAWRDDAAPDDDPVDWRGWPADWTDTVTAAFVERFGPWSLGWRWARDEGEIGGGPVGAWCCPRDSLATPQETLTRVVAAISDWRAWLEELAALFAQLAPPPAERPQPDAPDRRDAWERATARLITAVAVRTSAGDAWYAHCRQVLRWFLVFCGEAEDAAAARVGEATSGVFASWITPPDQTVHDVARRIADQTR